MNEKASGLSEAFLLLLVRLFFRLLHFRMWLAAVTRDAMYFQYCSFVTVFGFSLEKIFVDLVGHLDHFTRNTFFRFLVTGHVPIERIDLHVTKITLDAKSMRKFIHHIVQGLL